MSRSLSENEVATYLANITAAFDTDLLTGWDMDFLRNIQDRLEQYGTRTSISEKQQNRLDIIFSKTDVYRRS